MARGFSAIILIIGAVIVLGLTAAAIVLMRPPKPSQPQASPSPLVTHSPIPKQSVFSPTPQATASAAPVLRTVSVGTSSFKVPSNWQSTVSSLSSGYAIVAAPTTKGTRNPALFVQVTPANPTTRTSMLAAYDLPTYTHSTTTVANATANVAKGVVGQGPMAKYETAWFFEKNGNDYLIRAYYPSSQPDPSLQQVFTQIVNSFQF